MSKLSFQRLIMFCDHFYKLATEPVEKEHGFEPEEVYIETDPMDDDYVGPDHPLNGLPDSSQGSNYGAFTEPQSFSEEELINAEPAIASIVSETESALTPFYSEIDGLQKEINLLDSPYRHQLFVATRKLIPHLIKLSSLGNGILSILGDNLHPNDTDIQNNLSEIKEELRYIKDILYLTRTVLENLAGEGNEDSEVYNVASRLSRTTDKIFNIGVKSLRGLRQALVFKKRVGREDWSF